MINKTTWRKFPEEKPIDDNNYLVSWYQADGKYSLPHRAFYDEEEKKFFSLESFNQNPLVVDIFIEMASPNQENNAENE